MCSLPVEYDLLGEHCMGVGYQASRIANVTELPVQVQAPICTCLVHSSSSSLPPPPPLLLVVDHPELPIPQST